MQVNYPLIDSVQLYYLAPDSTWQSYLVGDLRPFGERHYQFRDLMLPLHFFHGEDATFFVRVKSSSSFRAELLIASKDAWHDYHTQEEVMYGVFYGTMLVMILYNLFVFLTLRDVSYLYYVLSTIWSTLFFAGTTGHTFQYLWPNLVTWANHSVPFSMGMLAFFTALFSRNFLDARKYSPWGWWALTGVMALGILVSVSEFVLGYGAAIGFAAFTLLMDAISILTVGFISWRRGNKTARYFLLAWMAYLLGGIFMILVNFGVLPANIFFAQSVKVGSVMEVILLSLALSDRYNIFREEKEAAQAQLLKVEQEAKDNLAGQVTARTAQLAEANEELKQTVEELNITNEQLHHTNFELGKKNQAITDSIRYAKRIQSSFLPPKSILDKVFEKHFTLFVPRDVVSGDFYWYERVGGKHVIVAADCTGHGVPGAFMSMLGNDSLVNVVVREGLTDPSQILQRLDAEIKQILRQDITENRDGMDAAICVYDPTAHTVSFAGAKRPLIWFDRQGHMHKIKGSRYSIAGDGELMMDKVFEVHTLPASEIAMLYLFSDGYADQFGHAGKMLTKRFYTQLQQIHKQSPQMQQEALYAFFMDWKGQERQTDDVLVWGMSF
jgi:serine phosphatase RsbU (regulator of sigma subunit)